MSNFQICYVDKEIASETIELKRQYSLKIPDAIIAATAIRNNAIMVTRDEDDFQQIKGLAILNPFKK